MICSNENVTRQSEELEALKSIYGDEWQEDGVSKSFRIVLEANSVPLELCITLPEDYPEQSPPVFQILAPTLNRAQMIEVTSLLQQVYLENIGETVIFQWIEKAREWLQDKSGIPSQDELCHSAPNETESGSPEYEENNFKTFYQLIPDSGKCEYSNIVHGDPIIFKKSTFQGHTAVVTHVEQIKNVLAELKKNKKIANATHNMYAYRIYKDDTKCFSQDCEDDGEAQAGGRLLHLLQIMNIQNVIVVVSRWYGGVHLGPDRFRLINNSARQVIEKAGLLPPADQKKKKKA